ncbi:integrin alpha FG-GAP repeat containing protein 1 [Paragonimus westermani]|uniref:Integrin alpha FG-GAP repeat containing protein 1 n=1 Tax=Paragonimus westermani TaxID=34504 RepID=A0A5J4NR25_9TREM|nr:integrin alpha FG-GAP repeat containing protein 1 [Paragonimus westermani]
MDCNEVKTYKRSQIFKHLENGCDVKYLQEFCITTFGLMDNEVRRRVWPIITGVESRNEVCYSEDVLTTHHSYHQVKLDVNRLDSLLPPDLDSAEKDEIRAVMMRLTVSLLLDNPHLHYYQGFHDICYIFLSVLGENEARSVLNRILPQRFSLFMEASMDSTVDYMQLIFALLGYLRPTLTENLEQVGLGPHFALAWIVTWFAHVLQEMDDVRRLFDLFLATDPLMLIYLSVAIIIRSDEEVQSTTADFGMLHHTLLRLPKKHPVEELVRNSVRLYSTVPPDLLLTLGKQRQALSDSKNVRHKKQMTSGHRSNVKWYFGAIFIAALAYVVYWWRITFKEAGGIAYVILFNQMRLLLFSLWIWNCLHCITFSVSASQSGPSSPTGPSGSTFSTACTWPGYQLAAFADLNADRQMDVVLVNADGTQLYASVAPSSQSTFALAQRSISRTLPNPSLLLSPGLNEPIRSVAAADFNGDSVVDLLILTSSSGPYTAFIAYGETGSKRGSFALDKSKPVGTFTSQPLVCDLNSDAIADLYGQTSATQHMIIYGGNISSIVSIPYNGPKWSSLGYSAFGDVDGDTIPDVLILVEQGDQPKLQLIRRDVSSIPGLPDLSKAELIDLPRQLEAATKPTLGLFSLGDYDSDGKIELLLPACTTSGCRDGSHIFMYDFELTEWASIDIIWEPKGAHPSYSWSLAETPVTTGLTVSSVVGPTVGDFDLDGRPDVGVGLAYWSGSSSPTGTVPAVLLNEGVQSSTERLQFRAFLLSGASLPEENAHGTLDIFVMSLNEALDKPTVSLFLQQLVNDFYFIKVTVLNGLCSGPQKCPDNRFPYGLPVPGLSSSFSTEGASGAKHVGAGLIGVQSCCSALQLPSIVFGLGPFANYVDRLNIAIPPVSRKSRLFAIPALVPNSEVFVNPYPHDSPNGWTARLFLQPLYNMKVLYIAITLICVCVVLIAIITILHCLELREDRLEKQREAQRFHFDAM